MLREQAERKITATFALVFALAPSHCSTRSEQSSAEPLLAASSSLSVTSAAATVGARVAPGQRPPLSLSAQLGKELFFDRSLSASGNMSCATCHDPNHAYGPPNDLAVQLGGPKLDRAGTRAVPSLRYKEYTPAFADMLDNPDGISAPGPGGGLTWDGRATSLAEQAKLPLLSPLEMANADAAAVVSRVLNAPYAVLFKRVFPGTPTSTAEDALGAIGKALQAFQLEDASFHPYSSKFDLYASNKIGGELSPAEVRGMKLFSDANRANCASCHYQGAGLGGSQAIFTDYSFEALGAPRNRAIPANADAQYFDLGVCGPAREDHPTKPGAPNAFCALFKTPTLRNVAQRKVFLHNGVLHSLEQVLRFYNTRDTKPELWYPTVGGRAKPKNDATFPNYGLVTTQYVGGKLAKYDDLPPQFRSNIDAQMPLDGRKAGSKAPLTEQNIADLLCFLDTLTDDYVPPKNPPTAGPCVN